VPAPEFEPFASDALFGPDRNEPDTTELPYGRAIDIDPKLLILIGQADLVPLSIVEVQRVQGPIPGLHAFKGAGLHRQLAVERRDSQIVAAIQGEDRKSSRQGIYPAAS